MITHNRPIVVNSSKRNLLSYAMVNVAHSSAVGLFLRKKLFLTFQSFVHVFSQSLQEEYRSKGIIVQVKRIAFSMTNFLNNMLNLS